MAHPGAVYDLKTSPEELAKKAAMLSSADDGKRHSSVLEKAHSAAGAQPAQLAAQLRSADFSEERRKASLQAMMALKNVNERGSNKRGT